MSTILPRFDFQRVNRPLDGRNGKVVFRSRTDSTRASANSRSRDSAGSARANWV